MLSFVPPRCPGVPAPSLPRSLLYLSVAVRVQSLGSTLPTRVPHSLPLGWRVHTQPPGPELLESIQSSEYNEVKREMD